MSDTSSPAHRERWLQCHFLVPLYRDSDRLPHPPRHWAALRAELHSRFGGVTGPEGPIPGTYTNRAGQRVDDESHRYTVALPPSRVDELRRLLVRVANTFDQESIYLSVGVEVELVYANSTIGDLGEG